MNATMERNEQRLNPANTEQASGDPSPLAWEGRVFLVALVGLIPGVQLGCMVTLLLATQDYANVMTLGGLLGMIGGGLLECRGGS